MSKVALITHNKETTSAANQALGTGKDGQGRTYENLKVDLKELEKGPSRQSWQSAPILALIGVAFVALGALSGGLIPLAIGGCFFAFEGIKKAAIHISLNSQHVEKIDNFIKEEEALNTKPLEPRLNLEKA